MPPRKKRKLSAKQARFVAEYLVDANAKKAAIAAGYSKKTADVIGGQLLRNPLVSRELSARQEKLANKLEVTAERVLREYARLAFSDPRHVAEWTAKGVTLKPSANLTDDQAACLAEIASKDTEHGVEIKFKLHDKKGALDSLAKHLGMFTEKVEIDVSITGLAERLKKARQRAMDRVDELQLADSAEGVDE